MEIIDKRNGKIKFKEMKNNDTFLCNGKICMKVSSTVPVFDNWNAYNFNEKSLFRISDVEETFEPVKVVLTIID